MCPRQSKQYLHVYRLLVIYKSQDYSIDVYGSERLKTEHPNTEQKTVWFLNGVRLSEFGFRTPKCTFYKLL